LCWFGSNFDGLHRKLYRNRKTDKLVKCRVVTFVLPRAPPRPESATELSCWGAPRLEHGIHECGRRPRLWDRKYPRQRHGRGPATIECHCGRCGGQKVWLFFGGRLRFSQLRGCKKRQKPNKKHRFCSHRSLRNAFQFSHVRSAMTATIHLRTPT